jgi:hypothetical protein
MSGKSRIATFILSIVFLAAIAAGGYWVLLRTRPQVCPICERSIHPHSAAIVLIDNQPVTVCCIRCGITHNFQVGKPGEIIAVTEYTTDRLMKPERAFYVEGSRISMCDAHGGGLMDQTKHSYPRLFDRCEPSTYAFADRGQAEDFARANGGKLLTWEELSKEARKTP